jgi:hypothetical protein
MDPVHPRAVDESMVVVAHPFTGTLPERDAFDLACDVGAAAYFPGARVAVEGRVGVLVDLRATTTGEEVVALQALDVPEHVIAAAEASEPKGLIVCLDDGNPEA